jgi:glycosyltransferase involved in cell wall biosynthesis
MKIIQLTDYPIDNVFNEIQKGCEIERHNVLYGYDALLKEGYEVVVVCSSKRNVLSRTINFIGRLLGYTNTYIQIKCLLISFFDSDVKAIYCHMLQLTSFLSVMRKLKILKVPILTISHDILSERQSSLKVWSGIDEVLALSEKTLSLCIEKEEIPERHKNYIDWGADLDFCSRYVQEEERSLNYIVATGVANRDYDLLIEVFRELPDIDLKIFSSNYHPSISLPANITVDNEMTRTSTGKLLPFYYNAIAAVIPLKENIDFCNGSTILFEAMAMKRPIIITKSKANVLDVEKEKMGFEISFSDKDGWVKAINYLQKNPVEANEMGVRGFLLAKERYNYNNLTKKNIKI